MDFQIKSSNSPKKRAQVTNLIVPENAVDHELLHSRIHFQAPIQASPYQSTSFFANRLTKAQQSRVETKKPIQLDPLPILTKHQALHQPEVVRKNIGLELSNKGWLPPVQSKEFKSRKRSVTISTTTFNAKKKSVPVIPPVQKSKFSYPRRSGRIRALTDVPSLKLLTLDDVIEADINNPLKIVEILRVNKRIGFLYMMSRVKKSSTEYTPYNLRIASFDQIDPNNYMTISESGVINVIAGESTFTPLDRWEQEYKSYLELMKIPLFKVFRIWKAFQVWRRSIRWFKYTIARNFLMENLFVANVILSPSLLRVWKMCYDTSKTDMTSFDRNSTYRLDSFCDIHYRHLMKIRKKLIQFQNQIKMIVRASCRDCLEAAGFPSNEHMYTVTESGSKIKMESQDSEFSFDQVESRVSFVGIHAETKMTYTEQATKRTLCVRLTCFIKLVDYLILTTLHNLVFGSLSNLLLILNDLVLQTPSQQEILSWNKSFDEDGNLIRPPPPPPPPVESPSKTTINQTSPSKTTPKSSSSKYSTIYEQDSKYSTYKQEPSGPPLFLVEFYFHDHYLSFQPSSDDFLDHIGDIILRFQETALTLNNMVFDKIFDPFMKPLINKKIEKKTCGRGPSLATVFDADLEMQRLASEISNNLASAFNAADIYSDMMWPFIEFYQNNEQLSVDNLREKHNDVPFFAESLDTYNLQHLAALEIENQRPLGLLLIDAIKLKEKIVPSPLKCLDAIHQLLPDLARKHMDDLINEVQDSQFRLEFSPGTTMEYVEYLTFLEDAQDRIEKLDTMTDLIVEMYKLIKKYNVMTQPEDQALFTTMSPSVANFRNVIDRAISHRDEMISRFTCLLEKDVLELINDVKAVKKTSQEPFLLSPLSEYDKVMESISSMKEKVDFMHERAFLYKSYQKKFKVPMAKLDELEEVHAELQLKELLWQSQHDWDAMVKEWYNAPFTSLNPDEMNEKAQKYQKYVHQLEKGLPPNHAVPVLQEKVTEMKAILPIVSNLRNPFLKKRHWESLENSIGHKLPPSIPVTEGDPYMCLDLLSEMGAFRNGSAIEEVSGQASGEAALEIMLKKVEDSWKSTEFNLISHRGAKDVFILGGTDDIQLQLEDSRIAINTIASSRYVGPIKHKVTDWQRHINIMCDTLDEWLICQRNWLYLESIFSAPDIQRQLPAEAKMFLKADKSWKEIMRRVNKISNVYRACLQPGLLEQFQNNNSLLDQVQTCLEAYLESKRVIFPRFYFLSNDELLEILAQTRNPKAVQPHLRKCFDAIASLEFAKLEIGGGDKSRRNIASEVIVTNDINAMVSPEGEVVTYVKGLKARGNVEDWLGKVEEEMISTLKKLAKAAMIDYPDTVRETWCVMHPSQIVLTISQVMWCIEVTEIICKKFDRAVPDSLSAFEKILFQRLNKLAALVRTQLPPLHRNIITALITVDVHARDIISNMVKMQVTKPDDFEWLRQVRYYWNEEIDDIVVECAGSTYVYGYEYLGACPRLVITPLTDRCYLCLMGALRLDLGGSPLGPAGTGKTETTKDLAKALAKQCVVFNCSEGLDYKMMGRFFSGLAQSGAWCCFDEFNRIDIEVLSVIAKQLLTIRHAKAAKMTRFVFEGREMKLDPTCAAFITMNPGYAGRTELPDNLKAMFRPIAMMVPDYKLIAEVILYSEGFESSKILAQKMVQMYKLCSEQLSQQDHYDFGMRAVKSVLVMAGSLKRENPDIPEDTVLIRALRDSNLPKFLEKDAVLFRAIISDLFPGVEIPDHDYGAFETAIKKCMEFERFYPVASIVKKVIQLYETLVVRHGVMLVGPTGGGKTTIYRVLAKTLSHLHSSGSSNTQFKHVTTTVLNPKSISMGELYGEQDKLTLEWKDGLMAITVRSAVQEGNDNYTWVVCDGPVDSLWIENMNTVLDDNKMLCLANSERIKLSDNIRMLFEVQDLAVASPATVSRCGMVYVDPGGLGWFPYVKRWFMIKLYEISEETSNFIFDLFETYLEEGLRFVEKEMTSVLPQSPLSMVSTLCALLQSFILDQNQPLTAQEDIRILHPLLANIFIFCYVWALAGNSNDSYWDIFDTFVRGQVEDNPEIRLPNQADLFSYHFDFEKRRFDLWENILPAFQYNSKMSCYDVVVPTVDTVRFGFLMDKILSVNYSVLYTGDTGVGKSVIARSLLESVAEERNFVPIFMHFSAQTSSSRSQEFIESKLERKKKEVFCAPAGKRTIIFIDDINMPKLDRYGSQPPIELLRQYQDFGGFYDREKLFWKEIQNVTLAAACAPPGGGRNHVTPRFLRHFAIFNLPAPSELNLKTIFSAIVRGFLLEFPGQLREMTLPIVDSAIEIYRLLSTDLLPTPTKSHYIFNLRDLSKCIQGILRANPSVIMNKDQLFDLFCHESLRVFHDRLINKSDKNYFYQILSDVAKKIFLNQVEPEFFQTKPIIFGNFMRMGLPAEQRMYENYTERLSELKIVLESYLDEYNFTSSKEMNLVFFQDAVDHISRIARILTTPRGNALLVGVGGCGKQSLTRLACFICEYECMQVELTRGYNYASFHEDLKKIYKSAGEKGLNTVFLFTDTQIVQEEFLEDINNILNSGEVPNLYERDELEAMLSVVRPIAKSAGIAEDDRDGIFQHFISRIRQNLHVVLCMSPVGDAFRSRCRMFPSLVNCCTIDWYVQWPKDALLSVSQHYFAKVENINKEHKDALSSLCVDIHVGVSRMAERFFEEMRRHYYTTPTSYLELLNLYVNMLVEKKKELTSANNKFKTGLSKLLETNELVDNMQEELVKLKPVLKQKTRETDELMEKLSFDQEKADKVRKVVLEDEAMAKVKAEDTQAIADDAQKDLDAALPLLRNANKALDSLDKSDIAELKVFANPPDLVMTVMETICILLNSKPDWASAKLLLSDANFLRRLLDYDKDNISSKVIRKLDKYIDNPDFVPEKVEKVSKACRSMCMWVRAMHTYSEVVKIVGPKRERLRVAQVDLDKTMNSLQEKQAQLREVENKMADLQAQYDDSVDEKDRLVRTQTLTRARLKRADKLTSALADEQIRWKEKIDQFELQIINVVGDVLIAAACVAYCGAFTSNYREHLLAHWSKQCRAVKLPTSYGVNLVKVLGNPYEIRQWNLQGLPRDDVSTENAIMVTRARRWPLMIDPQDQANYWIRNKEMENNLKVIKLTEANFLRTLENCISVGVPVLCEEVLETLDPSLEPILLKQTFISSNRLMIRLGDSDVDYDANFRFYMTSKLSNPHYLPEVCVKVTVINFTVTKLGLENQVLSDVVGLEKPELEEQRSDLIARINDDKNQLVAIENEILKLLFKSQGNILDNENLINALNDSKETSAVITTRLEDAETTEQSITEAREKYRLVATRGSVLFFVIASLSEIDPMYQFSLQYFKEIFNATIKATKTSLKLEKRLKNLLKSTTYAIYRNVSRALFERHKLVFSFMLCVNIVKQSGLVSKHEWDFFLRGPPGVELAPPSKPEADWLTDILWKKIFDLETNLPCFEGLSSEILHRPICLYMHDYQVNLNPESWFGYKELAAPPTEYRRQSVLEGARSVVHSEESSSDSDSELIHVVKASDETVKENSEQEIVHLDSRLTLFQKLIVVKMFKEEKVVAAVLEFVSSCLGSKFIESPAVSLSSLYKDMSKLTPLIFVLSTGSDPMGSFMRFANKMNYVDRLEAISLGQGQGPVAEKLMRSACENGGWVFLQNCHLAKSFMPRLESLYKELKENGGEGVHSDHRLFLSSMPTNFFPVAILQGSVKVTNEPPKGLRPNIRGAFSALSPSFFENHSLGVKWRKMIFGLCFFHAVIQERKKFGPLGWNILYDFTDSDRECALLNLELFCTDDNIPWDALTYITGEITYGGRVTDAIDQRCLRTVLSRFFRKETLDKDYYYSESFLYFAPEADLLSDYIAYVDRLPAVDDPEIFGMHDNANFVYQKQETNKFIETVLRMQPRASGGGAGKLSDGIVHDLALRIIDRLQGFRFNLTAQRSKKSASVKQSSKNTKMLVNSLETVLEQEVERFKKLLKVVLTSLRTLNKAIEGLVVMGEQQEEIYQGLMDNHVPQLWAATAYPSLKPLASWVKDLSLRCRFIERWSKIGQPTSFWISGFFFPQGFLTGALQNHARKYDFPIDRLDFSFQPLQVFRDEAVYQKEAAKLKFGEETASDKLLPSIEDGIFVHGLYSDAFRFDVEAMKMASEHDHVMNEVMPILHMDPRMDYNPPEKDYLCPLYKTAARAGVLSTTGHSTNFVISAHLPTDEASDFWISRGSAMLCSLES